MRKPAVFSILTIVLTFSIAACGKSMSSPAAPDASVVASGASATLSGTVGTGSGDGLAASTSGSTSGMTISVVGSSETTTVDATGRFRIVITPSGNLQLKITGPGVDSVTTVGTVTAGDTIEITININGSTAEIEDSDRASGEGREIEGRVEAIPPTTAAGTFKVSGKLVTTTASTIFRHGDTTGTFADVVPGARVHVKAAPTTGTVLTATEVNIQNSPAGSPAPTPVNVPVELNGTISGLSGIAASFAFEIDGRHVLGNASTVFNGNGSFSDMKNGSRAEVKAEYRTVAGVSNLYATSIHVNK